MSLEVVDIIALGIIAFFTVLGLFKGFAFQVVRLITFIVALAIAKSYAGTTEGDGGTGLTRHLLSLFPNQFDTADTKKIAVYISFFLIFIGVFILGTLLAFLLRKILKQLELRAYDKIFGGALGVLVGAICVVVLVSAVAFFSPNSEFVKEKLKGSYTIRFSAKIIDISMPFFPEAMRTRLNEVLKIKEFTEPEKASTEEEDKDK